MGNRGRRRPHGHRRARRAGTRQEDQGAQRTISEAGRALARRGDDATAQDARRRSRPLFASHEPLILTLKADFKAINRERTENSTRRFPGTLLGRGATRRLSIPVDLGSRGHSRLRVATCGWVPLRVQFKKKDVAGTVFDGQSSLKLVTHCRDNDDFEQHVLREYVPYRIYGLSVADRVSRPAREDHLRRCRQRQTADDAIRDVHRRRRRRRPSCRGAVRRAPPHALQRPRSGIADDDDAVRVHDRQHGRLDLQAAQRQADGERATHDVPGAVRFRLSRAWSNTPYANPDPKLGITSVRDRIYRGPCGSEAEFDPVLAEVPCEEGRCDGALRLGAGSEPPATASRRGRTSRASTRRPNGTASGKRSSTAACARRPCDAASEAPRSCRRVSGGLPRGHPRRHSRRDPRDLALAVPVQRQGDFRRARPRPRARSGGERAGHGAGRRQLEEAREAPPRPPGGGRVRHRLRRPGRQIPREVSRGRRRAGDRGLAQLHEEVLFKDARRAGGDLRPRRGERACAT